MKKLVLSLWALGLGASAFGQCPAGSVPYVQTRDASDALHVASCINFATGIITLLNGVPAPPPSGSEGAQPRFDVSSAIPTSLPPGIGGPNGAGQSAVDTSLASNRIWRLTDWQSEIAHASGCGSYESCSDFGIGSGGSAEHQMSSWDNKRVVISDAGGDGLPFSFDPNSMRAIPIPPSGISAVLPDGDCNFTANHDYKCYYVKLVSGDPQIYYLDFTSQTVAPSTPGTLVYDVGADGNCFPSGYPINSTNSVSFTVSADASTFVLAPGNAGQGSAYIAVAVQPSRGPGSGCRYWQTGKPTGGVGTTGAVAGSWGSTGASTDTDNFTIHTVNISNDATGTIVRVDYSTCLTNSATCNTSGGLTNDGGAIWTISTLTAIGAAWGGHIANGKSQSVNGNWNCSPICETFAMMPFTSSWGTPTNITNTNWQPPSAALADFHASDLNANSTDTNPFCLATFTDRSANTGPLTGGILYAWEDEIICPYQDGSGLTARYVHTFSTFDTTGNFHAYDTIGSMSRDGTLFFWTSDFGQTLGTRAQNISSWSRASNVVTVTNTTATPYAVGDKVQILNAATGGGGTTINGTFTLTAVSGSTFSFAQTATNDSSASAVGADIGNRCAITCRADIFVTKLNPSANHP